MHKVRVELPVLLYVDAEVRYLGPRETLAEAAKVAVWCWLGEPGTEQGVTIETADQGLTNARIYPSNHEFCDSNAHFEVVDEVTDDRLAKAVRTCLGMLQDQYTCTDREMCDRITKELLWAMEPHGQLAGEKI